MILNDDDREHIREMNFRGLSLQAYGVAGKYGPIRAWTDPRDRLVASYLAENLGAPRLAHALSVAAYAGAPDNLEIRTQYADTLLNRRGPLACWEFLQDGREPPPAPDRDLARWYAFHAHISGIFRDFDEAETWMARAAGLGVDDPMLGGQQVFLLQCQDRYAEALDKARDLLGRCPWYGYAWHATAHLLMLQELCLEAERLLTEATERLEVPSLWSHLHLVRAELDRLDGAAICLDRYEQATPLREKEINQWLLLARSYLASRRGDYASAADKAEQADTEPAKAILRHLKDADGRSRRNVLQVPFVRQHYITCAPATLTALSRFWSKEVDHLQVAEEICYAGTPHHEEREWALRNGFVTREFTLTWDSARPSTGTPTATRTTGPRAPAARRPRRAATRSSAS
jgi:tetratricopeptide (TPR) repeat protein